ncbi:phosphopantetheine-protein transferase [Legionella birminghamensis]|uniref:Phosphopantetheine-protein transferase n=2 Tax=Legionella birminghamensis TaxID=28083 RepID=A0A378I9K2_9GAMM|nr:phosphopantetheine-protein transferase [Legionella birminghamensis]STX31301.1 phosphopantetheine-protein transferase [Legionella birminghamensis]
MPLSDCFLQESRIDIWQFPLTSYPELSLILLDSAECQRAERFLFEKHRRRFIAAHAALRLILSRYLQMPADKIEFTRGYHGKPAIRHCSEIEFNLSHSGEIGLLGIGCKHPLGIDIEQFSPRSLIGLANYAFSSLEIQAFMQVPRCLQFITFFKIWAKKEAFIKASGLGLHYPTQQFTVPVFDDQSLIFDSRHQKNWQMYSYIPQPAYAAALCYEPEISTLRELKLESLELLLNE